MDDAAALRTARVAGFATLGIGSALAVAPRRVGRLADIGDARLARAIGIGDLTLVPGLLAGRPRWPWLAARSLLNVVTAAVLAGRRPSAWVPAAALAGLTVVDGAAARHLWRRAV